MIKLKENIFIILVIIFLYLPIGVLILYAFNSSKYSMQWSSPTLKWFTGLMADSSLWHASKNSLWLSSSSATLATIMATAHQCANFFNPNKPLHKVTDFTLLTLVIVPDIVFAAALLIFLKSIHMPLGFLSLLIAHVAFCLPFCIIIIRSQLALIPHTLIDAAFDLGASAKQTFNQVLLPLVFPAIFASWLISFTLSFDDVLISYFVAGPNYEILALNVYSLIRTGVTPEINALCSILFLFTMSLVLFSQYLLRKRQ